MNKINSERHPAPLYMYCKYFMIYTKSRLNVKFLQYGHLMVYCCLAYSHGLVLTSRMILYYCRYDALHEYFKRLNSSKSSAELLKK